jgi:large repetitive protein
LDQSAPVLTVAADGSFSQAINLPANKTYAIIVTATDQAGNKATVQRNIIKSAASATGDINGDGEVDVADALKVLRIDVGLETATADDYFKADVALQKDGKPAPDGVLDIVYALVILKKTVKLMNW